MVCSEMFAGTAVWARSSLCLALVCGLFATTAQAQGTDTVERITKSHVVNIGVRDNAEPFSVKGKNGAMTGYTVELCRKVVEQMRKELKLSELRAQEVIVSPTDRFAKLKDGTIDMECTLTTNTQSRQSDFDFSYPIMFSAQRFLTTAKSGLSSQADLAGKTVAAIKGSNGEKILNKLHSGEYPTMKVVSVANNDAALAALEKGEVQGILQTDVLLEFLRLKSKAPQNYIVTTWPMTVEPIAILMRKGDARFSGLVNNGLKTLFGQNEFKELYNQWFTGRVTIPLSAMMIDNMHRPSATPGFSLVMGVEL